MRVWVLLDETWNPDQVEHEEGTSCVGVFSSREKAMQSLGDEILSAESFAAIVWTENPGLADELTGRLDDGAFGQLWRIVAYDIDAA